MYALAIVRYRKPMDVIETVLAAHRAYLLDLKNRGILLASGPLDPRSGGAVLFRVPDEGYDAFLDRIRDEDPFTRAGVAQYEILPWNPNFGREALDTL